MMPRLFGWMLALVLWLLHFLPLGLLARLGTALGHALRFFGHKRRRVAEINLQLCFPELGGPDRARLLAAHFACLGRSLLERSIFWWAGPERLERLIQIAGEAHLHELRAAGRPIILLAPHFVGLDAGGVAITQRFDIVSIYAAQRNPVFDRLLLRGRSRFGNQMLLTRQDGARATVKAMKGGRPFYYLPDLNARRRDSVFVPFFGVPAATITGLSRLARAAGAAVVPCVTRMLPGGQGYLVDIGQSWADFPSDDPGEDAARMNRWLEDVIRTMPEQYYWVHRRFKTRPLGEAGIY